MSSPLQADFLGILRAYMAREGISGRELARQLGVSSPYVSQLLTEKTVPTTEQAAKLLARVGIKLRMVAEPIAENVSA